MKRKKIEIFLMLAMLLAGTTAAFPESPGDQLKALQPFAGKWVGKGNGEQGPYVVKQVNRFVLKKAHFQVIVTARFKPKKGDASGKVQKKTGIFSFDPEDKMFRYREFGSDGTVRTYRLISINKEGKTLTFQQVTAPGKQKQLTRFSYRLSKPSRLTETVSVSTDGKTFREVEKILLRKVGQKKKNRVRGMRKKRPNAPDLE